MIAVSPPRLSESPRFVRKPLVFPDIGSTASRKPRLFFLAALLQSARCCASPAEREGAFQGRNATAKDGMVASLLLLTGALAMGQAPDPGDWDLAPRLEPGLELVYSGSYVEEALVPNVQFRKKYRLDTVLLVLNASPKSWEVAFLTTLSRRDGRSFKESARHPDSVRLEIGTVDRQGLVKGPGDRHLGVSLSGPPTIETGVLVEFPVGRVRQGSFWLVNEAGRPPRNWQVVGTEQVQGVTCIKLVGQQESEDWSRPRADSTAWRRRDTVWLSPQLMVAQKVERVIERRAPARREPTQRGTVTYELESRLKYPGKLFEDRRLDIQHAQRFHGQARPLLERPAIYRPQIEALDRKIALHLDRQTSTPYRQVLVHLRATLEQARQGNLPTAPVPEETPILPVSLKVGQRVGDGALTDLRSGQPTRLANHLGKPLLVVFYDPSGGTAREVLRFTQQLCDQHKGRVAALFLAVTREPGLARKQYEELGLKMPLVDGNGLHRTFGVEATPRLVLLDGEGVVRAAFTGWGFQVPGEIRAVLDRCFSD